MDVKGLYVIINWPSQGHEKPLDLCEQALRGGADVIQFRNKSRFTQEAIHTAKEMAFLCRCFQVPFILNDHVTLVEQIEADGIHVGQDDMCVHEVRQLVGKKAIIGVSASKVQQAQQAELSGSDYLGCGHIYPTLSKKKTTPPIGIQGLKQVVDSVSIPVIAIGGIHLKQVHSILTTEAAGVAVLSEVAQHPDPAWVCKEIKSIIDNREETACCPKS